MKNVKTSVKFNHWVFYCLLFPLLPILLGVIIAYLQAKKISYVELCGGTELFFFAVTIFAATRHDLDNSGIDFKNSLFYSMVVNFLMFFLITTSLTFAVVYVHERIDIGLKKEIIANMGLMTLFFTVIFCTPLEFLIIAATNREEQPL